MGHYASEVDPNWGDHIDAMDRERRLKDKIKDIPLSKFKAKDLPLLNKLFSYDRLSRDDEKRLKEMIGE